MQCEHNPPEFCYAGMYAINAALDIAYAIPGVTHVARLDDDDAWDATHLSNLVEGFSAPNSEVGFVYTQSTGVSSDSIAFPNFIFIDSEAEVKFSAAYLIKPQMYSIPPFPCKLIPSASAWSKMYLNNFKFRTDIEQIATERSIGSKHCEYNNTKKYLALPGNFICKQIHLLLNKYSMNQWTWTWLRGSSCTLLNMCLMPLLFRKSTFCTLQQRQRKS
jgi:hypothetical protein